MTFARNRIPGEVLKAYGDSEDTFSCSVLGKGNINDTWLADTGRRRFILQRINSRIFTRPENVISNFQKITRHLAVRSREEGLGYSTPELITTRDGVSGFRDSNGDWWRAQSYVENEMPPHAGMTVGTAFQLGRVLATYHYLVGDLVPSSLVDVLPGFHVLSGYLQEFDSARGSGIATHDHDVRQCVSFVDATRSLVGTLEEAQANGELQARVIHGDPKIDNVIFSGEGKATGLFDLDTVGSGLLHYDLGDCLRSACNRGGELTSPQDAHFDIHIYEAFLKGYREGSPAPLSTLERKYIYDAALTITFELGLRFLTDHVQGDKYFKVSTRGENLYKSRVQFALAESIIEQEAELRRIAENV